MTLADNLCLLCQEAEFTVGTRSGGRVCDECALLLPLDHIPDASQIRLGIYEGELWPSPEEQSYRMREPHYSNDMVYDDHHYDLQREELTLGGEVFRAEWLETEEGREQIRQRLDEIVHQHRETSFTAEDLVRLSRAITQAGVSLEDVSNVHAELFGNASQFLGYHYHLTEFGTLVSRGTGVPTRILGGIDPS